MRIIIFELFENGVFLILDKIKIFPYSNVHAFYCLLLLFSFLCVALIFLCFTLIFSRLKEWFPFTREAALSKFIGRTTNYTLIRMHYTYYSHNCTSRIEFISQPSLYISKPDQICLRLVPILYLAVSTDSLSYCCYSIRSF